MTTELETEHSRFTLPAKSIFYFEIPLTLFAFFLKIVAIFSCDKLPNSSV